MASLTLTVGDTTPPLRGAVRDENELLPLSTADEVKLIAVADKGAPIEGDVTVLDPPEDIGDPSSPLGFNWRYDLDADDTEEAGTYAVWLKITWDSAASPPKVEWVKAADTIVIQEGPE